MACDCIEKVQKMLVENENGKRVRAVTNTDSGQQKIGITTVSGNGTPYKSPCLVATFCPFCGVRYEPEGDRRDA